MSLQNNRKYIKNHNGTYSFLHMKNTEELQI